MQRWQDLAVLGNGAETTDFVWQEHCHGLFHGATQYQQLHFAPVKVGLLFMSGKFVGICTL